MKRHWSQDVSLNPKSLLKFPLDPDQADKGSLSINRIDQDIKVTVIRIFTVQDGTEDAGVARIIEFYHASNIVSMQSKGFRGSHGLVISKLFGNGSMM